MSKNLRYFLVFFIIIISSLAIEITLLSTKNTHIDQKRLFVQKVGLPDLAVST
ncbi:MAG: hypothetical protein GXO12_06590, partial [Epsilonproteobacteria bacterium]|nr:hypothetical protein [Campylobacterota bacterium]